MEVVITIATVVLIILQKVIWYVWFTPYAERKINKHIEGIVTAIGKMAVEELRKEFDGKESNPIISEPDFNSGSGNIEFVNLEYLFRLMLFIQTSEHGAGLLTLTKEQFVSATILALRKAEPEVSHPERLAGHLWRVVTDASERKRGSRNILPLFMKVAEGCFWNESKLEKYWVRGRVGTRRKLLKRLGYNTAETDSFLALLTPCSIEISGCNNLDKAEKCFEQFNLLIENNLYRNVIKSLSMS